MSERKEHSSIACEDDYTPHHTNKTATHTPREGEQTTHIPMPTDKHATMFPTYTRLQSAREELVSVGIRYASSRNAIVSL
jgi:hypothetical protein